VATGAAIKWITKDGFGALGRFVVGGSLARFFDEDPRFWRFFADLVASAGLALEIGTAAVPSMFLLLAGVGNFTKVSTYLGRGIWTRSRRACTICFVLLSTHAVLRCTPPAPHLLRGDGELAPLALSCC
jgi:hypothetical protein